MKILLIALAIAGLLVLSGCTQAAGSVMQEISACNQKCSEICQAINNSGLDLGGYNVIGVAKVQPGFKVSCECPCKTSAPQGWADKKQEGQGRDLNSG